MDALIERVLRAQAPDEVHGQARGTLGRLRETTGMLKLNEQPVINSFYAQTFREVDNFDALLGHVAWHPRLRSPEMFVLVHGLRMATVNAVTSWLDLNHAINVVAPAPDMRAQARKIAAALM